MARTPGEIAADIARAADKIKLLSREVAELGDASPPDPIPDDKLPSGVALRYTREISEDLVSSHPLIDFVVESIRWHDLEPVRSTYDFGVINDAINRWVKSTARKKLIVRVMLYGQMPDEDQDPQPPWLSSQSDVRMIEFRGGGRARGNVISVPAVWDETFVPNYVQPLAEAMADTIDANDISMISPGFGHIGNLTAQPSRDGARALLAAGWSPEKWKAYCVESSKSWKEFPVHQVTAGGAFLIRDRRTNNYAAEATDILQTVSNQNHVSSFAFGGDPDDMGLVDSHFAPLLELAAKEEIRLGTGDDWPLFPPADWVDKTPTLGRDINWFRNFLSESLERPIRMFWIHPQEAEATHPTVNRDGATDVLRDARERLLVNEVG